MFFEDELEQIVENHKEDDSSKEMVKDILICWKNRIPDPDNVQNFINKVRQLEYGWQLFCKKHKEFKPQAFRNFILEGVSEETKKEQFRKAFHW